ncbi:MAG: hypothetical protein WCW31_05220, partial [Patescibacteria group bacterium]
MYHLVQKNGTAIPQPMRQNFFSHYDPLPAILCHLTTLVNSQRISESTLNQAKILFFFCSNVDNANPTLTYELSPPGAGSRKSIS